jgi:hypothetical protein
VGELPIELYKSHTNINLEKDGSITYDVTFFNVGVGTIRNSITFAIKPYDKMPKMDWYGKQIKDLAIGSNAQAFQQDSSRVVYIFFKGNSLVQIYGTVTLEEAIILGNIIEKRLPDQVALLPITFPAQVNKVAFDKYLKSLTLEKEIPGSGTRIPTSSFSTTDRFCLSLVATDSAQSFVFAIYDIEENVITQKFIPEYGQDCYFFTGIHHPGQYEIWVAVNDTLLSKLPFEMN